MTTKTNNIIRQLRHRAGLTQLQLSEAAGYRAKSTIAGFEDETDGPPGIATVCRIAYACKLPVGYFSSGGWLILPEGFEMPQTDGDLAN